MIDHFEHEPNLLERLFLRLAHRLRPSEGWLALTLLAGLVYATVQAVIEAEWVRELGYLHWVGIWSMLLNLVLIKGKVPRWRAVVYSVAYGFIAVLAQVGQLVPPFFRPNGQSARDLFLLKWETLFDRLLGWWRTVESGGGSRETIAFELGLAFAIWLIVAYVTYATFARHRPLPALLLIAFALAINSYFTGSLTVWSATFLALMLALTAYMHLISLEHHWQRSRIDFSQETHLDFFLSVLFVTFFLTSLSSVTPTPAIRRISTAFANSSAVAQVENMLERVFGGVDALPAGARNGQNGSGTGTASSSRGGRGVMPRSYLLGDAPELYETVVLTATVDGAAEAQAAATHWRALSYDHYTGRGWAIADERQQLVLDSAEILHPPYLATAQLNASVNWVNGSRASRYSLGIPIQFNQETMSFWRGSDDFVRVTGAGNTYQVQSAVSIATPAQLRIAPLDRVPRVIADRYTDLPDSTPDRVLALAEEITANATTPYDQAVAIEQFLRQYPYSLDIAEPPGDVDVVDYFLFEAQEGYCDYYATSMAVLGRAVGLPTRIGIGFAAAPADESGVQTLRQIDGHSWAEVYFAEYGWVEFEPTAGFSLGSSAESTPTDAPDLASAGPAPIPDATYNGQPVYWPVLLFFGTAAGLLLIWFAVRRRHVDTLEARYARLHRYALRLDVPTEHGQTPAEFQVALDDALLHFSNTATFAHTRTQTYVKILRREAVETCRLYALDVYGADSAEMPPATILSRQFDWLLTRLWLFPPTRRSAKLKSNATTG